MLMMMMMMMMMMIILLNHDEDVVHSLVICVIKYCGVWVSSRTMTLKIILNHHWHHHHQHPPHHHHDHHHHHHPHRHHDHYHVIMRQIEMSIHPAVGVHHIFVGGIFCPVDVVYALKSAFKTYPQVLACY